MRKTTRKATKGSIDEGTLDSLTPSPVEGDGFSPKTKKRRKGIKKKAQEARKTELEPSPPDHKYVDVPNSFERNVFDFVAGQQQAKKQTTKAHSRRRRSRKSGNVSRATKRKKASPSVKTKAPASSTSSDSSKPASLGADAGVEEEDIGIDYADTARERAYPLLKMSDDQNKVTYDEAPQVKVRDGKKVKVELRPYSNSEFPFSLEEVCLHA